MVEAPTGRAEIDEVTDRRVAGLVLAAATFGTIVASVVELVLGTWGWPDAIGPTVFGVCWVWLIVSRRLARR